jgi:ABC transport system ATP-binding/permease protein
MALVSVREVSHSFGGSLLFDKVTFHIERGERICLLGRNGAGKSTLMQFVDDAGRSDAGALKPDDGAVTRQQGIKVARLAQNVPAGLTGSVFDLVIAGLGRRAELLAEYHRASADVARSPTPAALQKLDRLHRQLDLHDAWQLSQEVERVLTRLNLDGGDELSTLSGGGKRRALLARALVGQPDLLLLDEPTNHLDIPTIEWLEEVLLAQAGALIFVTHDRAFVRKLATRVIEIDRGKLYDWECDYDTFVLRKRDAWAQEAREWQEFDKTLAQEETWIHRGTQARITRNMGRVRALIDMREARAARRVREGTVQMRVQNAERTGTLVIGVTDVTFGYGDAPIIRDLTATIERGDKVGIIGLNGSGKTTLLRLLLGELEPQSGTVRHGTGLQVAYFDQMREHLDPALSVQESVNDGNPILTIDGQARHVIGYLGRFLFPPQRLQTRVADLSGGERTRLMLARLFARPFNVLVMDEPANDLDLETLELLEGLLIEYQGTLLLVSHDRALLNNVVNRTLALEEGGRVGEYAGGYDDWLWQRPQPEGEPAAKPVAGSRPASLAVGSSRARRISFAERHELEVLPGQIEALEQEQQQLYETLSNPKLYQENGADVTRIQARLDELDKELEAAYARWTFLEELPDRNPR